jgi:hypothetical protein
MSLTNKVERVTTAVAAVTATASKLDVAISEHVARQVDASELVLASQILQTHVDDAAQLLEAAVAAASEAATTPTPDAAPVPTLDPTQAAAL